MSRNIPLTVIRVVVWFFLIGAVGLSTTHVIEVGLRLGLGWQAYTLPAFVDGLALVGKVSMLPRFSRPFRRSGFRLLMLGGLLSLAANIYAGSTLGSRGFGALIVAGFLLLESHVTKADRTAIAPPPVVEVDDETRAKRSASARKAAATRKANARKAKAALSTRKPRTSKTAEVVQLEEAYSLPDAPVSGG